MIISTLKKIQFFLRKIFYSEIINLLAFHSDKNIPNFFKKKQIFQKNGLLKGFFRVGKNEIDI